MSNGAPYPWHPQGTRTLWTRPPVGTVVAYDHAVWRVVEVRDEEEPDRLEAGYAYIVVLRPAALGDDVRDRDHDRHLAVSERKSWEVFDGEHYPVCARCGEPVPCREVMSERVAEQAAARIGRYELEGVCPACSEPVTARQRSITFSENLELPGGPPLTFHLRRACVYSAMRYERRWAAADPARRRAVLSCAGRVTTHNDGTYSCSELADCPGPTAWHSSYSVCRCPDCHARGSFDCRPPATARRV